MKIILTGVTGFIGQETLRQCIANPAISSIVALSRRALPESIPKSTKLSVVIVEDFTKYSPEITRELEGAQACVWNLGVKNVDIETGRKVSVEYTKAAINAFSPLGSIDRPFRFVFMSGFLASRDQTKSLWFFQEARRLKGEAENLMIQGEKEKVLVSYVLRPASVLPRETGLRKFIQGLAMSVDVAELSAAAMDFAVRGDGEMHKTIWENRDLVAKGKAVLAERM